MQMNITNVAKIEIKRIPSNFFFPFLDYILMFAYTKSLLGIIRHKKHIKTITKTIILLSFFDFYKF